MESSKDWLEAVLKRKAYEESPIKVIDLETIPNALGAGQNFQSKIGLIRAQVLLGSGKIKKLTLFVKDQHDAGPMRMLSTQLGVFNREITIYRDVLPKMENLLEDSLGDTEGKFWPACYDIRLYDRIILEDLRESGYKTVDRKEMLGLEGAILVVKQLAKFHAMSKILLDKGEIPADIFGQHLWQNPAAGFMMNMMEQSFKGFIAAVEKWGDEWKSAAEKLKNVNSFCGIIMDLTAADPKEFKVLGHGDCWLNNILLRGDDKRPTSVRFIDFQQSFIASPAVDLTHFLVASVRLETRQERLDDILQAYCDTLKTSLLLCGHEGPIPAIEDIKTALNERSKLKLWFAVALAPLLQEKIDMPDMESMPPEMIAELMKSGAVPDEFNVFNRLDSRTEKLLKFELQNAVESGAI